MLSRNGPICKGVEDPLLVRQDLHDSLVDGVRAEQPVRKSNMQRLSYEWLAGLREIVIDPVRCPLAYEDFGLKEFERDRDGTWVDEIPDGNDHGIDTVRYAVMDNVQCKEWLRRPSRL